MNFEDTTTTQHLRTLLTASIQKTEKLVNFLESLENDQHDRVSPGTKDSITHLLANLGDHHGQNSTQTSELHPLPDEKL